MRQAEELRALIRRVCTLTRLLDKPAAFVEEQDEIAQTLRRLANEIDRRV